MSVVWINQITYLQYEYGKFIVYKAEITSGQLQTCF